MNVFNKQEAAALLKIKPVTIDRQRRLGRLPYHKIGDRVLFTQSDIDRFLERTAVKAGQVEA